MELEKAVEEVIAKLSVFGFKPKFIFYNWKEPPPELTEDFLVVFHQKWNFLSDEVTPGLHFNKNPKNRGISKGCSLTQMSNDEIINIKLTKTLIARLLGQIYDLSGLLSQVRASLLSLFFKTCQLLKDWTSSSPQDHEISVTMTNILLELATDIPNIRPFSRCKIPEGSELQRIIVFSGYCCLLCLP